MAAWAAVIMGNSRLHWAVLAADQIVATGDVAHPLGGWVTPDAPEIAATPLLTVPELWVASVVPAANPPWQALPQSRLLSVADVPLKWVYPTLGLDRALALWGAIATVGAPVLVIDGGTALTLTAADGTGSLVGGAILPGVRMQFRALGQQTAQLPQVEASVTTLPPRWARTTEGAIASGIWHTVTAGLWAFIQDWHRTYPASPVVLTGGDGDRLWTAIVSLYPEAHDFLRLDPHLIVRGMAALRSPT